MKQLIFLDRDGVINISPSKYGRDYITGPEFFKLIPGVIESLQLLSQNGCEIHIVSNQSGVNRGVFTEEILNRITDNMLHLFTESGINIDSVSYCIHSPSQNCSCRKPGIKLFQDILSGCEDFRPKDTFYIGDQENDIKVAAKLKIISILVLSGKSILQDVCEYKEKPDYIAFDLLDAVKKIILQ